MNRILAAWLFCAVSVAGLPPKADGGRTVVPRPADTQIRIARSADGFEFLDVGGLIDGASAPTIVLLRNDALLVVFDRVDIDNSDGPTRLKYARSGDGGWTWSTPRNVRIDGAKRLMDSARHPALVRMPTGNLDLYFIADVTAYRARRSGPPVTRPMIWVAASRKGGGFRLVGTARLEVGREVDPLLTSIVVGDHLHLYADDLVIGDPRSSGGSRFEHLVSLDGRRFSRLPPAPARGIAFAGSVVPLDGAWRAFVTTPDGVRSLVTRDGADWVAEPGVRVRAGWAPAVVQLRDRTYLMLYCANRAGQATSQSFAALDVPVGSVDPISVGSIDHDDASGCESNDESIAIKDAGRESDPESWTDAADEDSADDSMGMAGEAVGGYAESPPTAPDLAETSASLPGEQAADAFDKAAEARVLIRAADEPDTYDETYDEAGLVDDTALPSITDDDHFAPLPDFAAKTDYVQWFRDALQAEVSDNAYDAYMSFMPSLRDKPGEKPDWPELRDMFNGENVGLPAPWEPADHPEWAETDVAAADLRERFRKASLHADYATPADTDRNIEGGSSEYDEDLLIGILLPSLQPHRAMVKSTLANAWKKENGAVSSERMLEAWRTSLRAARHLDHGAMLIEELVARAERELVLETARWALKHGVFEPEKLADAFSVLRQFDYDDRDPSLSLRGEHAAAMDIVQYLFTPASARGQPQPNETRARSVFEFTPEQIDRFLAMTPRDVRTTIRAFRSYYRELGDQMRIGYPDVRASDLDALTERYLHVSPLTEEFLPALSRYYKLKTRTKATRRATQLVYAAHVFEHEMGRWPESLPELAGYRIGHAFVDQDMLIDPFTGDYFGYRVTADGPVIYSFSENGRDDGGIHAPRWDDGLDAESDSDDFVFWPPQQGN